MSSRREQILAHLATILAGTAGIGTVWRSRVDAVSRDEAPALLLEPIFDRCQPTSNCRLSWTLDVAIVIFVRGSVPDTLADPILVSAHSILMADRTLGGLAVDIVPTTVDPQRDKADLTSLWQVNTYQITYRTLQANLETG